MVEGGNSTGGGGNFHGAVVGIGGYSLYWLGVDS